MVQHSSRRIDELKMLLFPILVWMLLILDQHVMAEKGNKNNQGNERLGVEGIMRALLRHYSKEDPPRFDAPTKVELGVYVNSIYSISEQTMDYMVDMYLRQRWQDKRLAFTPVDNSVSMIWLRKDFWEKIWVPDTFFRNEEGANFHYVTVENRLMTLNATGHLWYVIKFSVTLSCPMKLHTYPLDTQYCPMLLESFGYNMDTMYFVWLPSPVDINPNLQLPQFTLKDYILYDCSQNYSTGTLPCLEIKFMLQREIGFFLLHMYVPSSLIVILSWVSFWIDVDAIPARVSLGLVTVLTLTTQSSGVNQDLRRVSYVKAIDVWLSMCLAFAFMSLLEFAVVNVISRKQVMHKKPKEGPPLSLPLHYSDTGLGSPVDQTNILEIERERRDGTLSPNKPPMDGIARARRIDKFSRKIFPVAFMLFNVVYWVVYMLPEDAPSSLG